MKRAREQFVGVDVAKEHLDVHFHPDGRRMRLANDEAGHAWLQIFVALSQVKRVVMESTGPFGRSLARTLADDVPVFVVPPQRVRQFAHAIGVKAKTDQIDAAVIAHYAATAPFTERAKPSDDVVRLRDFVTIRQHFVLLKTTHSNFTGTLPAELREIGSEMRKVFEKRIAVLDKQIMAHVKASSELAPKLGVLMAMTGVGGVLATTLLSSVPELGRCSSKEIASLIGVAPFNEDSGKRSGRRSIRGGRKRIRPVLYMAARAAVRYDADLKAFYERLLEAGKENKVAITAVMRKLVVIANAKMRDHIADAAKGQPAAAAA